MAFVLDKNGEYLPVFGDIGASGSNFIPANTVYHIKADGSGDFATLKDAIDSLNGKLSNDAVTIELGAGTFEISSSITIDGSKFHIPQLKIKGAGATSTIISSTISDNSYIFLLTNKLNCRFEDIKILKETGTSSTDYRGMLIDDCSFFAKNLNIKGINNAIYPRMNSEVIISGTLNFEDCKFCLTCASSRLTSDWQTTTNFTNVATAFAVNSGGEIHGYGLTCNYTDVTTKTSQTVGTATNNGWITGITV